MATLAKLVVELGLDDAAFSSSVDKSKNKLDEFGKKAQEVGQKLTAAVTLPIVGLGTAAFMMASDLNEAMSAVSTVFGTEGDAVIAWSENAATTLGISQAEALQAMAALGGFFTSLGLTGEAAAQMGQDVLGAASDLASFYNADPSETLAAIQSGLVGSYEPLRKYGIVIDEAAVAAKAMEMGLADANGEISEAAKVQARQALITEQMGAAQGDFSRTSGSVANQMRILKARFKDILAQLGQKLLPIGLRVIEWLNRMAERFSGLNGRMQKIILIVGAVVAAIGPLLWIIGTVAAALPALGTAFAILTGPIGLIIAALVLLTIAYKKNWFGFGDAVRAVVKRLVKWFTRAYQFVADLIGVFRRLRKAGVSPIQAAVSTLRVALIKLFGPTGAGKIFAVVRRLMPVLKALYSLFADGFRDAVRVVKALISGDWKGAWDAFITLVKNVISNYFTYLKAIAKLAIDAFKAIPWRQLGEALWNAIKAGGRWAANLVGTLWDEHSDKIAPLAGRFVELIGGVGARLWEWAKAGARWFASSVRFLWDEHRDTIGSLAGRFIELLGLIGSKLWEWAKSGAKWFASTVRFLWDEHKDKIGGLAARFIDLLGVIGSKLWQWAKAGAKWFAGMVSRLWDDHKATLRNLAVRLIELLGLIGSKLWEWAKSGAKWFARMVPRLWDDHKDTLKGLAIRFIELLGLIGTKLWEWAKSGAKWFASMVSRLWDDHRNRIAALPGKFIEYLGVVGSKLWEWAKSGARWFASMVGRLWDDHKDKIAPLTASFITLLGTLGGKLWEWARKGAAYIASVASMFWNDYKDDIAKIATGFIDALPGIGIKLWTWLKDGVDTLVGYVQPGSTIYTKMTQIGATIGTALKNGVTGIIDTVKNYLVGKINDVIDTINDFINSYNDIPMLPEVPNIPRIGGASTASTRGASVSSVNPAASVQTASITINVSGAGDPQAVANAVYATLARQMALREGM